MKFDPEVFISYSHLDDEPFIPGRRWVTEFHRALLVRVRQKLGDKEFEIFRDPELQGNDDFSERLRNVLHRTGVLVPVVSPGYVNSEWTRRELAEFLDAASKSGGVKIGDRARLFKVVKTPVPDDEQPPELDPFLGYEFFDRRANRAYEFDADDKACWAKVDDMACDIEQLFEVLREEPSREFPPPDNETRTVYLAETTFDLRAEYDEIRRDLQQRGHRVLPVRSLPRVAAELQSFVRNQIQQADISVHLIGAGYSFVPEGGRKSVLEMQDDLTAEKAASPNFRRLVWIPAGLKLDDERQAAFIHELRLNPRTHQATDFLETSLEELKTMIYSRLKPAEKPRAGSPVFTTDEVRQVYFVYDKQDLGTTAPWEDFLFAAGLDVIHPVFEGDEAGIRQVHEDNLRLCDAVLIHYGVGNELWLRGKLNDLEKIRGLGRSRPFRAIGISIAPPITPEKLRFRSLKAMVIRQAAGFDPALLDKFIAQARCN